jgi:hypothetical protein
LVAVKMTEDMVINHPTTIEAFGQDKRVLVPPDAKLDQHFMIGFGPTAVRGLRSAVLPEIVHSIVSLNSKNNGETPLDCFHSTLVRVLSGNIGQVLVRTPTEVYQTVAAA